MFRAMIFLQTGWGFAEGNTKEEAISHLKEMMPEVKYSLSFRPIDGTIYHNGNHIPCGVVFGINDNEPRVAQMTDGRRTHAS